MSFTGKVAIVTGASSGIGAATAIKFAEAGASVVIVDINETKLKDVSDKCNSFGDRHHVINGDVTVEADVRRTINETINKYGKIDVLVNNAGILRVAPVVGGKLLEIYDEVIATNLRPAIHFTALAAPHLIASRGNIVMISSVARKKPLFGISAYCTSKAALSQFSKSAALELAEHGVRVNAISPGAIVTDIYAKSGVTPEWFYEKSESLRVTPLQRTSSSEEVADLVLFLASDKAVGVTGSDYCLDNGLLLR